MLIIGLRRKPLDLNPRLQTWEDGIILVWVSLFTCAAKELKIHRRQRPSPGADLRMVEVSVCALLNTIAYIWFARAE